MAGKKWISGAIKKPGALHEQLGVPLGQKIPKAKVAKAAKAGGTLGRRARLAQTLGKMNHAIAVVALLWATGAWAANDLTADPLIIDTAGAGSIRPGICRIHAIKWVGATGAGSAIIQDVATTRAVWEHTATAAGTFPLEVVDLSAKGGCAVTTLGSGRLYLYLVAHPQ